MQEVCHSAVRWPRGIVHRELFGVAGETVYNSILPPFGMEPPRVNAPVSRPRRRTESYDGGATAATSVLPLTLSGIPQVATASTSTPAPLLPTHTGTGVKAYLAQRAHAAAQQAISHALAFPQTAVPTQHPPAPIQPPQVYQPPTAPEQMVAQLQAALTAAAGEPGTSQHPQLFPRLCNTIPAITGKLSAATEAGECVDFSKLLHARNLFLIAASHNFTGRHNTYLVLSTLLLITSPASRCSI